MKYLSIDEHTAYNKTQNEIFGEKKNQTYENLM